MKKFEYKTLEISPKGFWGYRVDLEELTQKLNELGKQGWEAFTQGSSIMSTSGKTTLIILLKREIN